jgi:hypothetical protein
MQPGRRHVGLVHEHHAASAKHPAVTIVEPVHGGVELIVRADRHHHEFARRALPPPDRRDGEIRPFRRRAPLAPVARRIRQIENGPSRIRRL